MGIFIKNAEVERKARELARRRGQTLTGVINQALDEVLAREDANPPRRRHTAEEMKASTDHFRKISGLDKALRAPITKAEWDAMWPIGIPEIDNL